MLWCGLSSAKAWVSSISSNLSLPRWIVGARKGAPLPLRPHGPTAMSTFVRRPRTTASYRPHSQSLAVHWLGPAARTRRDHHLPLPGPSTTLGEAFPVPQPPAPRFAAQGDRMSSLPLLLQRRPRHCHPPHRNACRHTVGPSLKQRGAPDPVRWRWRWQACRPAGLCSQLCVVAQTTTTTTAPPRPAAGGAAWGGGGARSGGASPNPKGG